MLWPYVDIRKDGKFILNKKGRERLNKFKKKFENNQ